MDFKICLAESEHYAIISEFETVSLIDKATNTEIIIGDFYGDPEGAIIDTKERFVAHRNSSEAPEQKKWCVFANVYWALCYI